MNDARSKPPSKVYIGVSVRQGVAGRQSGPFPLSGKEARRPLPLGGEGSVLKKDPLPGRGREGLRKKAPLLDGAKRSVREKDRDLSPKSRVTGMWQTYPAERSSVSSRERAVEVHCRGLAEGIITVAGAIMTNKTGWSSPIGATCQTE
jgi:hypothetical protein